MVKKYNTRGPYVSGSEVHCWLSQFLQRNIWKVRLEIGSTIGVRKNNLSPQRIQVCCSPAAVAAAASLEHSPSRRITPVGGFGSKVNFGTKLGHAGCTSKDLSRFTPCPLSDGS